MTDILGGEVGVERSETPDSGRGRVRNETVELVVGHGRDGRPGRHVEVIGDGEERGGTKKARVKENDPADDPSVHLKTSYSERVKMDRYASQMDFDIKNPGQVFVSVFSFFKEPVDYVNPRFVTKRIHWLT